MNIRERVKIRRAKEWKRVRRHKSLFVKLKQEYGSSSHLSTKKDNPKQKPNGLSVAEGRENAKKTLMLAALQSSLSTTWCCALIQRVRGKGCGLAMRGYSAASRPCSIQCLDTNFHMLSLVIRFSDFFRVMHKNFDEILPRIKISPPKVFC